MISYINISVILNFLGNQIKLFSFYFDFLQTNISLVVYFNQLTGAVHRFHWSKYAFCHFSPQFDKKKGENDNVKKSFSNMLVHTASPILITTKKKSFRLKIPHSSATAQKKRRKDMLVHGRLIKKPGYFYWLKSSRFS